MEDIRIEDLLEKCKRCNGKGSVDERYKPSGGFNIQPASLTGACPDCNGSRGKLTKSGEAIAELFQFLK
jgi:DnaJ-class molecular chaperone